MFVGPTKSWIPELVERAKVLRVNNGFEENVDLYVHFVSLLLLLIYPLAVLVVAH